MSSNASECSTQTAEFTEESPKEPPTKRQRVSARCVHKVEDEDIYDPAHPTLENDGSVQQQPSVLQPVQSAPAILRSELQKSTSATSQLQCFMDHTEKLYNSLLSQQQEQSQKILDNLNAISPYPTLTTCTSELTFLREEIKTLRAELEKKNRATVLPMLEQEGLCKELEQSRASLQTAQDQICKLTETLWKEQAQSSKLAERLSSSLSVFVF